MYKNKDKQREANRLAKRAQRARDNEPQGMTWADNIIPKTDIRVIPKRGLDIKCFEDLPSDVQQTIGIMSVVEGVIDQTIKANRTAIAINYQHLYPDRYYSTGI